MTLAHLRRVIALSVACWAAAAPSGAATIDAPATSTGAFTARWPSGYELRLADVNWRVAAAGATSATFTALPPGEYRFVLAACSWTFTTELGALYLCNVDPSSAKTVTVEDAAAPAVEEWTTEAGSTAYRAGVGRRGNAEIAVPLRIPAGMNGVVLDLALEYDSVRNGDRPRYVADDLLGYGWTLRGVPYIHRCRAGSMLDSSLNGLPTLTSSDGICLDGEPLVKVGGTHWSAGAEYRKAADPDLRVTLRETSGVGRWFEVRYPDGAIARFGDTADSRVLASGQASGGSTAPVPSETYVWGLRSLTGALGNVLTVSYRRFDGYGHLQPETVAYGGAEVRFRYGPRTDLQPLALTSAVRIRRLSVLQGVEVRMNGRPLREYRLASRGDEGGRLRLEAIQECGYDAQGGVASCLLPLRLQWGSVTGGAMGYPIAVTELADGLGARAGFDYTTVTSTANPLAYGEAPFGALLPVADTQATDVAAVAEFRVADGLGADGYRRWTYRYKGGPQRSSRGHGFIGFPELRTTDQQSGIATYTQTRLDWPFLGAVSQVRAFDRPFGAHTQELVREEHAFAQRIHGNGSRHAYRSRSTRWFLEGSAIVGGSVASQEFCYRTLSGETCPGSGTEYDHATQRTTVTVDGNAISSPVFTPAFWGDVPIRTIASASERRRVTEMEILTNNAAPWIRGAVTREVVTHAVPGQSSRTVRKDLVHHAGTRVVRSAVRFPGDPRLEIAASRTLDSAAGNVTSTLTVQGVGMPARTWRFGTPYQDGRHVRETINPLGQIESRVTDNRFGLPESVTDPDGRARTIEYDPFGRRVRELAGDGTEITVLHERCDLADCSALVGADAAMKITVTTRNGATQVAPTRVTYLDALGRTVLEQVEALQPGQGWHSRRTGYDIRNRVRYRSRPVLGTAAPSCSGAGPDCTWYEYDLRDRVVREARPDGGVTTANWSGSAGRVTGIRTEIIKIAGQTVAFRGTRTAYDVLGLVTQSTDAADSVVAVTTAYRYDAHGNLIGVTVGGTSVATLEYDLAGNRTRVTEANSGSSEFAFNALGEVIRTVDAKGQATAYEHDPLGRLVRRTDAGGTAHTWVWDPPNGTGRLGSRTRPGFTETYVYAAEHGRVTRIDSQVNVPDVWTGAQTRLLGYDPAGRLASQQYPNGQTVTFGYSATGYLTRVSAGGVVLRELRATDAFGRPADERYHDDGLRTRSTYDPGLGRLTRIETGTPSALRSIQDLETTWRSTGNLHQRLDRRDPVGTADDLLDTFRYDTLERLTRQTTSGAAVRVLDFGYTASGNLTSKTSSVDGDLDVTAFVYGNASTPHRLSSVSLGGVPTTLSHDANGNVVNYAPASGPQTWLRYDPRNNVVRIAVGPGEADFDARDEFWYDPDDRRFLSRETWVANGVERSRRLLFLGGDYEEVRAADGAQWDVVQRIQLTPVARLIRRRAAATGAWEVFPEYVHRDHLGSVDVVTDGRGAMLARTSFDPFGTRRAIDRSRDLPPGELATLLDGQDVRSSRGFTDHEHRDRTGFVHMNGRVYDPRIGRFVAPDPVVQQPWLSQAYNRYAYVSNDPLSRTDPSGFCGRQEGYQFTVCEGVEEMLIIGQGSAAGGGYFGALNPEGGSILTLGPVGFGGFGGAFAPPGWDSLFVDLQARLAAAGAASEDEPLRVEEVVVTGPAPNIRRPTSSSWWSRGLAGLDGAGIRSLFGSACLGTVLGGCGALAMKTSTGVVYGMLLVGVFPGGGLSFGSEGVLFESDFQSNSGFGTAVLVSGGFGGFGGSIGMAQGTNGVNVTGAVGYGFGLGGGVGFYYAGALGSIGN